MKIIYLILLTMVLSSCANKKLVVREYWVSNDSDLYLFEDGKYFYHHHYYYNVDFSWGYYEIKEEGECVFNSNHYEPSENQVYVTMENELFSHTDSELKVNEQKMENKRSIDSTFILLTSDTVIRFKETRFDRVIPLAGKEFLLNK